LVLARHERGPGPFPCSGAHAEQPAADLSNDGVIDVNDLMIFLARYNQ
jgi:hypothetical protein